MDGPENEWKAFHHIFICKVDINAPWWEKTIIEHEVPYINSKLRDIMNEREKVKTLANKTQDKELFTRFKILKKEHR